MTHDSHIYLEDKMPAARSTMKHYEKLDEAFTKIMVEQSNLDEKFIREKISSQREWYISTTEARNCKLVDTLISPTFTQKNILKIIEQSKKENAKNSKRKV